MRFSGIEDGFRCFPSLRPATDNWQWVEGSAFGELKVPLCSKKINIQFESSKDPHFHNPL